MNKWANILGGFVGAAFFSCHLLAEPTASGDVSSALEIRSVSVNEKPVPIKRNSEVSLGSSPENIFFGFGARTNAPPVPVRVRYKLEGYESTWRDGPSDMFVAVRFYNAARDQISQKNFAVNGESAGWNGSMSSSPLTHRRETVVVPEQASRLWIVISSAGPPAAVGVYVVANLVVSKSAGNSSPVVLMESPFEHETNEDPNRTPEGWVRDGNHSSMANIVTIGQNPTQKAFAILDADGGSHAEWHNIMESAPAVNPGDHILIEWNEAFSMGVGDVGGARYQNLKEGNYVFQVAGVDVFGNPTGATAALRVLVPPPVWRTPWFWSVIFTTALLGSIGGGRYLVWQRMRREMLRLKSERALENERLRIAQDLHDDFGARVTEISIASALAKAKANFPESARVDFDRISTMSRELVSALYETVWAVNPENDNLDALGSFLCQMTNHLCEQAQLPCRLRVVDLPADIQVSSQTRHNIIMAAKEAVHNVIKHAHATEITLSVAFENQVLSVSIQDNGAGFQPTGARVGNGLINMKRRLADIGGNCDIQSSATAGTNVVLRLPLKPKRLLGAEKLPL